MISIGASSSIEFVLDWSGPEREGSAGDVTRGHLGVRVLGRELWPSANSSDAFEWPWIELLEHLARSWSRLRWESVDPLSLGGPLQSMLERAKVRWKRAPASWLAEDALLTSFLYAHDLSAGLNGIDLPHLWISRNAERTRVEIADSEKMLPSKTVFDTLERLGDEIAKRLEGVVDPRALAARTSWATRDSGDTAAKLSVMTLWSRQAAEWLATQCGKAANGDLQKNAIALAARMLGPVDDPKVFAPLFAKIRKTPSQDTSELDTWAEKARAALSAPAKPHEHGYRLARWLRKDLLLRDDDPIDVEARLQALKVLVENIEIPVREVDAVCAWGPSHGPVIFVNTKGVHAQGKRGRHATLAHELCHLLVDRGTTLAVAEVRGPHTPADVEARANAFAAELLFPQAAAHVAFKGVTRDRVGAQVTSSSSRYFASEAVVAWQALNSKVVLSPAVREELLRRASMFTHEDPKELPMMSVA